MPLVGRRSASRRRSGPESEERWWDAEDQRVAERGSITRRDLPKKWRSRPLMNNVESIDPFAEIPEGRDLAEAAAARHRTALDDGAAVAGPDFELAVMRIEVFADADHAAHRALWQQDGPAVLTAMYRHRWAERDHPPGWIEAQWPSFDWDLEPRVDWLRVEDHTDRRHEAGLFLYDHLWLWIGRGLGELTIRYGPGFDVEPLAVSLADVTMARLHRFEQS